MTFLNATLIFGIAAAAVPILLHLIARRQPRKVTFPSIRFLTKRFETNRSRLRVRRWWLLALRIAALAVLALALARPAIHQSLSITWLTIGLIAALGVALLVMASVSLAGERTRRTGYALAAGAGLALLAAGGWAMQTFASGKVPATDNIQPVAIAIVLDNGPSSAWKTATDDRIARMKELATWMVTRLPRTSRIAIVDRSPQVTSFSLDVASAVSKIDQLKPLEVTQPIASRIEAAARLVRTSELSQRQVLVVTDLSKSTWDDATEEAGLATLLSEDPPVALTIFDLGPFDAVNRSLSIPKLADKTPPRGMPVAVSSVLKVDGGEQATTVSVTAELDIYESDPRLPVVRDGKVTRPRAKSVDRTTASVAPAASAELLLTIPSLDIGTHHGRIRLIGDDALRLDDARYFTLQVLKPSNILLVGDQKDEATVISRAITAAPGLVDQANAEFVVERIEYGDLPVVRLADFDAVLLLDPPTDVLDDAALNSFAQSGGGVLICLGPSAGQQRVDNAALVPDLVRRWRAPDPGTFLQVTGRSHPLTAPVSVDTPWSDFRVAQYWQLQPRDDDTVLMVYAGTTHGALVERSIRGGQADQVGRVLILSTPLPALAAPARSWNDLFGTDPWPAWLLLRQCVEHLARRGDNSLMSTVGQPVLIPLNDEDSGQPDRGRIQLFPPGETPPVPLSVPAKASQVSFSDVSRSGTYWLRGVEPGAGFSANLPGTSIAQARIDEAGLERVFAADRYTLVSDREGIEFAENKANQRVSLHSPAILLVFVIFLLEQILGNRFYRSGGRPSVAAGSSTKN